MSTETKSHQLSDFGSDFERRFDEVSQHYKKEGEAARARMHAENDIDAEAHGVLEGIDRKWIGVVAVGAALAASAAIGMGKLTFGESFSDGNTNTPTMLERAKQNEQANLQHAKKTGEPLITDQK